MSLVCALGLHHIISLQYQGDHFRDHLRRVLTVPIHGNDNIALGCIHASRQCSLMTEIAAEFKYLHTRVIQSFQNGRRIVGGTVIHVIESEVIWQVLDDSTNSGVRLLDNASFVKDRDNQIDGLFFMIGLVSCQWHGREKLHYLNPMPIAEISRRWLDRFSGQRAAAILNLRDALQENEHE